MRRERHAWIWTCSDYLLEDGELTEVLAKGRAEVVLSVSLWGEGIYCRDCGKRLAEGQDAKEECPRGDESDA